MLTVSYKMKKIVDKLAKDWKDDLIVHSVYFYNLLAFTKTRFPIVITEFEHYPWIKEYLYHYPFLTTSRRLRWDMDTLLRIAVANTILPKATLITCVSKYQQQKLVEKVPIVKSRTVVIPNAVDPEHFKPVKADDLRHKLAGNADVVVIFVGRLTPYKGFTSYSGRYLCYPMMLRKSSNY